jgi:hypothetical protein
MVTPITERLRSKHLVAIGNGVPELCEEAARLIEKLASDVTLYKQASEYLAGGRHSADWTHDT